MLVFRLSFRWIGCFLVGLADASWPVPSPDRLNVGSVDAAITTDDWNAKIQCCRGDNPVGHVRDVHAWYLAHRFHYLTGKRSFSENEIGIVERLSQLCVRRCWEATFLHKIDNLGQADRREHDVMTGAGSVIHEPARDPDRRGFLSKYQSAVWVSATPAITERPGRILGTSRGGFHRFLLRTGLDRIWRAGRNRTSWA